jgi:PPK2 family polyphosphate:nucleotide phosphotransferase
MTFLAEPHALLVPPDAPFDAAAAPAAPPKGSKNTWKDALEAERKQLGDWQYKLYADSRFAMLLVFQALDAAGKDSTIRHVFSGVNPTGLHVHSFTRPSAEDVAHDFLWRTTQRLPQRGHVAIFNRSYYEEVLAVRVEPKYLEAQRQPNPPPARLWQERLRAIADHERHLAEQGTVILKFWLNVSADEQRERLIARIDEPRKHWKFNIRDLEQRAKRAAYLAAYSEALAATSKPWAPWYAIPADNKHYMRWQVANIVNGAFARLGVDFPTFDDSALVEFEAARALLEAE